MSSIQDFVGGSAIRIKLLDHLASKPHTPTELANLEQKHVSHVSRALAELKNRGLVECIPSSSRERFYRPTDRGYSLIILLSTRAK